MTNDAILQILRELTESLYYMSESDYPLEVVHFEKVSADELNDKEIRKLAVQASDAKVEKVDLSHFLRNMTNASPEADDTAKQIAEQYQTLQAFMEQHLGNVKVYRVGEREITALAVGTLADGGVAGFKTIVVET